MKCVWGESKQRQFQEWHDRQQIVVDDAKRDGDDFGVVLSVDILTNGTAVNLTVLQLLRTWLFICRGQGYFHEDAW